MTLEIETKIEKVYGELKSRIPVMREGMRFPSVREVMREFSVSQITVDRAMEMLAREGLIVKRPKQGTFVAAGADTKVQRHTLAVAIPNYASSVYEDYLEQLMRHVDRIGEVAEVIRYDWRERILQTLPTERVDGLILVPTAYRLAPGDIASLSRFQIPIVLISRLMRDFTIDCVEPDNERGGELAAEHLIGLGHRKLAVLLAEPEGVTSDSRIVGFVRKAKAMGVEGVEIINAGTRPGEHAASKGHEFLKARIRNGGLTFSGLFILSDSTALGGLKALHDCGVAVPRTVSVVGFGDIPEARLYHPSLTTIHEDHDAVARVAVEIIERRLAGDREGTVQRTIPPTLIVRESTRVLSERGTGV